MISSEQWQKSFLKWVDEFVDRKVDIIESVGKFIEKNVFINRFTEPIKDIKVII